MTETIAILNVLGRYTRAHDQRDGAAMAALFVENAVIEIFNADGGVLSPLGALEGRGAIFAAVSQMMAPHGPGGWSQNVISAPIVEISGDRATIDVQFTVFDIAAAAMPAGGWPVGTSGAQGAIRPIEAGQYHSVLRRIEEQWLIETMQIVHRLPMAFG